MNQINQGYIPPRASVGAVNIQIFNPTVTPGMAQGQTQAQPMPQTYPAYNPVNYPMQPPINVAKNYNLKNDQFQQSTTINQNTAPAPVEQKPETKPTEAVENKKTEETKKETTKKEIVPLTDEYIKTLENYLNNPNAEVRQMGAKELLARFKEDDSRKSDQALINLLNKTIQDPSQSIRLMGLAALDANYTSGDDLTVQLLKQMQNSESSYNQDALTASQILLKMAGRKVDISTTDNQVPPQETKPKIGQKLNLIAS